MASTCHEWTGWRPLRCRQSQILLIVLAEAGGDKGWCLKTARTDLVDRIESPSVNRPPNGHREHKLSAIRQPTTGRPISSQ